MLLVVLKYLKVCLLKLNSVIHTLTLTEEMQSTPNTYMEVEKLVEKLNTSILQASLTMKLQNLTNKISLQSSAWMDFLMFEMPGIIGLDTVTMEQLKRQARLRKHREVGKRM